MIYIISDGEHHKIGYTAGDPKDRLQMLQVGSSRALVLVTTLPGEMPDEKRLHTRFAPARVRGEWFALTDEDLRSLRAFSTWLLQYVGDDSIVGDFADDWQRDPQREPECWQDLRHALGCRGVHNDVIVAARAAWHEFTRGVPTKIVAEQRAYAARIKAGIYPRATGCFWLKDGMHSPELDRLRALRKAQEDGK